MSRSAITFDLEEPIKSYDETLEKLTMSPPRGKDILECGYPFSTERNPRTGGMAEHINVPAMRAMISATAGIPIASVDMMSALDFGQCVSVVRAFFYYTAPKTSSASTSE